MEVKVKKFLERQAPVRSRAFFLVGYRIYGEIDQRLYQTLKEGFELLFVSQCQH